MGMPTIPIKNILNFMTLDEIIKKAKGLGSYFVTITTREKDKEENSLNHYVFRQEFDLPNVISSLDCCVRSMGVENEKPVDVIVPPVVEETRKPLKIALLSHFSRMADSYSPARAAKRMIKILQDHGHTVVFFTQECSKLTKDDIGCEVRNVVPSFKRKKMVINEEKKKEFIKVLQDHLTNDFQVAITFDLFLQDTITYSEAIREAGVPIKYLHFARSGIAHPMEFSMDNAKFIYLNKTDIGRFAKSIKVSSDECRTVYNEKDIIPLANLDPVTEMIIKKYKLWEKDIIMTYPVCSTRLAAKGLSDIINVFAELKKLGKKVSLIVPNSNGRRRVDDLKREIENARLKGLNTEEGDFIFTSLLADDTYKIESEVSNRVCYELMSIGNLFIAASRAEVGPNTILEAAMSKNLLVINSDLPLFREFCDKEAVIEYPFTSNYSLHYSGREENNYKELAKKIINRLEYDWADKQFRFVWRQHNADSIYQMLKDVLYEDIK